MGESSGEKHGGTRLPAELLAELLRLRKTGWHDFSARDYPRLAALAGPPAAGEKLEIPIRRYLLALIDPEPVDPATGRPLRRPDLKDRDRQDDGLFGRILFGEPGLIEFPPSYGPGLVQLKPRTINLEGRYEALAKLRSVSVSTIKKRPKADEPKGGHAYRFTLDLRDLLLADAARQGLLAEPIDEPGMDEGANHARRWLAIGGGAAIAVTIAVLVTVGPLRNGAGAGANGPPTGPVTSPIGTTVSGQINSSVPGQLEGGDMFYVRNLTGPGGFGDPIVAKACEIVQYRIRLIDAGPHKLAGLHLQAVLSGRAADYQRSRMTVTTENAVPRQTSDTATVNLSARRAIQYVRGSTQLLDASGRLVSALPDGITQGGIALPAIGVGIAAKRFVQFRGRVSCIR